ncbi:scm-like with four MBT domains protein 2 [Sinocyclocheilus grahami]|uniref:scm-like with four MBT domains protein 2 n=1 Tax=Sinocyclocheilus grahami TaxID=75366 RepID=UPI0007ACB8D8|nr:PREDICTED: scm-like with four MBT domains protein 2 [Sinocyclocheilus grahami]
MDCVEEEVDFNWEEYLEETGATAAPHTSFRHVELSLQSSFQPGMKLEVANKGSLDTYWVATIITTCGQLLLLRYCGYGDDRKADFWCDVMTAELHPVGWCAQNNKTLQPPKDNVYLRAGKPSLLLFLSLSLSLSLSVLFSLRPRAKASQNRGFCKDMWLEAVNPLQPSELCVARITQVKGRLLWLRLEGLTKPLPDCIVDVESMNIFPVGWCEANGCPLTHLLKTVCLPQKKIAVVQPEKQLVPSQPPDAPLNLCSSIAMDTGLVNGKYSCSQLFINHRCFSGPYLNKGRIAELPKAVGPGKCAVVLKEILTMLINSAYKPGRVLRELQMVEDPQWNCQEETLKAKYKGKSYRSNMRIVRTADQVSEFCRRVCERLQCCLNLFGPTIVSDKCPENCFSQTKTKYTYYKKRKVGRPSLGDGDMTKPARRRKKRKAIFVQKKRRTSIVGYQTTESAQDSDYYYDDEEEDFEEWGSEVSSSSPREETSAHSFKDVPRRGRPPRRAALQRRATHPEPETSDRSSPRRTTRSVSYSQNQTAKNTHTKTESFEEQDRLVLERNPLEWSVSDVVDFITSTDCASLAKIFQEQDIDGQALLLLTLPTVQECMDLKLGPAIKLCHQIERVKVAFYSQFAN